MSDTLFGHVTSASILFVTLWAAVKMQLFILAASEADTLNNWEFISLRVGNGLFAAWLTVACILNTSSIFMYLEWRSNEQEWSSVMLTAAFLIYTLFTYTKNDLVYGLVFFWVLVSIKAKQKGQDLVVSSCNRLLVVYAIAYGVCIAHVNGVKTFDLANTTGMIAWSVLCVGLGWVIYHIIWVPKTLNVEEEAETKMEENEGGEVETKTHPIRESLLNRA